MPVSSAGDINDDGYDDMIVAAPDNDGAGGSRIYVLFGHAGGFGTPDGNGRNILGLATLTAEQGFVISTADQFDFAGGSIASAGDMNGDGYADIIIGARDSGNGVAYVLFGTYIGIGALAYDFNFSLLWVAASTLLIWAAPAQVILISMLGGGAQLIEIAVAVGLSGLRLLPIDRRVIRSDGFEFNQFPQALAFWRSADGPFAPGRTRSFESLELDLVLV